MPDHELQSLREEIRALKETNAAMLAAQHQTALLLKEMQVEMAFLKKSQESSNQMFRQILFIIGGGFLMAAVAWVVGGGLSPKL